MTTAAKPEEFLDILEKQVADNTISVQEALALLREWEQDDARTNDEIDRAWEVQQRLENKDGLMRPHELRQLLRPDVYAHLEEVMDELRRVANADHLNDEYAPVLETIIREASSYRPRVHTLLGALPKLSPALQSILDTIPSTAQANPEVDWPPFPPDDEEETQEAEDGNAAGGPNAPNGQNQRPKGPGPKPKGPKTPGVDSNYYWNEAKVLITMGDWDGARKALSRVSPDHSRFDEVPRLLDAIHEGKLYDQIPGLSNFAANLASSRSRRAWEEFDKRRTEAEALIKKAERDSGHAIRTPASLRAIFEEAVKAQDAEKLTIKAQGQREQGDFSGAATSLLDAMALDPRYAKASDEQNKVTELRNNYSKLVLHPSNTARDLADSLALAEQLLKSEAAPLSTDIAHRRKTILEQISSMVDNIRRRIEGKRRVLQEPCNLEDKVMACAAIEKYLDDIELLRRDDPDLPDERDKIAATRLVLASLMSNRDDLGAYLAGLKPEAGINSVEAEQMLQELKTLWDDPLVQGDNITRNMAQSLLNKFTTYLDKTLQPGGPLDLATLESCAEILRLASLSPRSLTRQQMDNYSRAIWAGAASLVRGRLPKSLPLASRGQIDLQRYNVGSEQVIDSWDHARRIVTWLQALPTAGASWESATLETLDREFSVSITRVLENTAALTPGASSDEIDERVASARSIKQYVQALPDSIRYRIPGELLQGNSTQVETIIASQKRASSMRRLGSYGVMVLLLVGVFGLAWPILSRTYNDIVDPPPPPTPTIDKRFDMHPYILSELEKPGTDCIYENSFNVCDKANRKFKQWYTENRDFLGRPISQEFEDLQISLHVQYFEMGRLEWSTDETGSRPTFGLIGDDLLRKMAAVKPNLSQAQKLVSKPRSGCESVPGYPHWLCDSFRDYFRQSLNNRDPVSYYGYPLTEEYNEQVKGEELSRQFFQRAIFQGNNGQITRLPVGILYVNWVRLQYAPFIPEPDTMRGMLDPTDLDPSVKVTPVPPIVATPSP